MSTSTKTKKRRNRVESVTTGVRLRPDQVEDLKELMALDPELDWSTAARKGIDLFLKEQAGLIRVLQLAPRPASSSPQRVYRSTSAANSRER